MTKPFGPIEAGAPESARFGFSRDRFDGYLFVEGDAVYIPIIRSKKPGKGHFRQLLDTIPGQGYRVIIPTPLPKMRAIVENMGFTRAEIDSPVGPVEIWEKHPESG